MKRWFIQVVLVLLVGTFGLETSGRSLAPPFLAGTADSLDVWIRDLRVLHRTDPEAALSVGERALTMLQAAPDPAAEGEVLYLRARAEHRLGQMDEALATLERVQVLARRLGDERLLLRAEIEEGEVLVWQGQYYHRPEQYERASEVFVRARARAGAIQDTVGLVASEAGIAYALGAQGRFDEAHTAAQRALDLSEASGDRYRMADALRVMARLYEEEGRLAEAVRHTRRALDLVEQNGDEPMVARLLNTLWVQLAAQEQYQEALAVAEHELEIKRTFEDQSGIAWDLHDIAGLRRRLGDLDGALGATRESLAIWKQLGEIWEIARNRRFLADLLAERAARYEEAGAYREAAAAYREYKSLIDALIDAESQAMVAEMQQQYQTLRQRQQIAILAQRERIQRLWVGGLVVGLGLIGVVAFLIYSRYRDAQRARAQQAAAYEELQRTRAEVDQMKARFFANISHELRTPMTLILGQVASVLDHAEGKDRARLQMAARNGQRLLRLINQLLDLAKLDAGHMDLHRKRADLISFLKGVFFSFESLAEARGITQRFTAAVPSLVVAYDEAKLEHVFFNLLSNAFKFTPPGGEVELIVRRAPTSSEAAEVVVRDTGAGIPPDRLPHIFDRFYQVGASHTREHEGTGIGLALTREMVKQHGGSVTVTSEVGSGTTFVVRLPVGAEEPEHAAAEPVSSGEDGSTAEPPLAVTGSLVAAEHGWDEPPTGDGASRGAAVEEDATIVLIVEDNADVRSYVRDHLEADYQVIEAPDGEAGFAQAQEVVPDLIITDVMMPKVDGYELSRRLRGDHRTSHIPIVMLTARAAQADKLEGLETGVDDYLIKPFSPRELQVRVRNLITLRKKLRERFSTALVIQPSEVEATDMDQAFLEQVVADIEAHLGDGGYGIEQLAEAVHMSTSQLNRKLNALVGQPAGRMIRSMRLQRAADLLEQHTGTIAEVAYRVGFSSQAHFSTAFKKQFGVPPSTYVSDR